MPNISLPDSYKFRRVFSIVALVDVNDGGTPYMGISPGRTRPCTHRPERERSHQRASSDCTAARDSLGKNVSKEVCFCEGKITLFSFLKNPALCEQWMQFVFPGQQQSFSSEFVNERFINKAQFNAGFAHHLILKDGAVPAIKDPGHDSEQQTSVKQHQMSVFCWWSCSSARHSLAPPTACRLQELGKNRKAPSFFYKYAKTKDFL